MGKEKISKKTERMTEWSKIIKSAFKVDYKPLKWIQIYWNLDERKVQKVKAKMRSKKINPRQRSENKPERIK